MSLPCGKAIFTRCPHLRTVVLDLPLGKQYVCPIRFTGYFTARRVSPWILAARVKFFDSMIKHAIQAAGAVTGLHRPVDIAGAPWLRRESFSTAARSARAGLHNTD